MKAIPVESTARLHLGLQGENQAMTLAFDPAVWRKQYGQGSVQLLMQRPEDEAPYPVPLQEQDGMVVWTVTSADTQQAGICRVQLLYVVKGKLVKSRCFTAYVQESLCAPTDEAPPPQRGFADKVASDAAQAEKAKQEAHQAALQAQESLEKIGVTLQQGERALIDRLCSPFSTSGTLALCRPVVNHPMNVKTVVVPRQLGAVSPDQPQPIQKWKTVSLWHRGKNFLNLPSMVSDVKNSCYMQQEAMVFSESVPLSEEVALTFSFRTTEDIHNKTCSIAVQKNDGTWLNRVSAPGQTHVTLSIPRNTKVKHVMVRWNQKQEPFTDTRSVYRDFQLEIGRTETEYQPYTSVKKTVTLDEPLLGGTLDWTQGILTKNWTLGHPKEGRLFTTLKNTVVFDLYCGDALGSVGNPQKGVCNRFPWEVSVEDTEHVYASNYSIYLFIRKDRLPVCTIEAMYDWMRKNPIEVAWRMDNTLETSMLPAQTLTGREDLNTLCSDAGEVTVEGRLDPIYEKQQLRNALTALGEV